MRTMGLRKEKLKKLAFSAGKDQITLLCPPKAHIYIEQGNRAQILFACNQEHLSMSFLLKND